MTDFEEIAQILNRTIKKTESTIANELVNNFDITITVLSDWLDDPFVNYEIREVHSEIDRSNTLTKVYKFINYNLTNSDGNLLPSVTTYVKITGWSSSYEGFYTESITEVEPKEETITRTVYVPKT